MHAAGSTGSDGASATDATADTDVIPDTGMLSDAGLIADRDILPDRGAVRGGAGPSGSAGLSDAADLTETQALAPAGAGGMLATLREPRPVDPVRAAQKRLRAAERQNKRRLRRETRRFTAASRRARRRVFIALGTVAGLVLFVLLGTFTPVMAVRDIKVEGATTVNVEDVQRALSEFEGVPLALVDENAVLRALETFPLIQRYAVERVPPKTLIVRIEERVPVIALETDGVFRMYDAAGVLVGEAPERPEGVPLGGDGLRSTSSEGFLAAAQIVRDMPTALRGQITSVDSKSGQDVTFQLASGVEVFWGNPEETRRKSLILEAMLTSLGERPVSHIDVSSTDSPIFR
ncbi:FtsQ-type POTRA domain-containing protein [Leucobacter sp. BZR 635]